MILSDWLNLKPKDPNKRCCRIDVVIQSDLISEGPLCGNMKQELSETLLMALEVWVAAKSEDSQTSISENTKINVRVDPNFSK